MQLQLFLNKNLALHLYYDEASVIKGKIKVENFYLLAPGLPSCPHKNLFKDKVSKNTAFMVVYYYGSWFSGGKFLFENCVKSVKDAILFVKKGQGVKTFDNKKIMWEYENLFLIGNSFGGSVICSMKNYGKDIKKIFLYAPFLVEYSEVKKNKEMIGFLRRGYKNNYRGIDLAAWDLYFAKKDLFSFIELDEEIPPTQIIHGKQDNVVPYRSSEKLQKKYSQLIELKLKEGAGHDFNALYEK